MSDERNDKIKAALSKLNHEEPNDWTEGGLPAMGRMKELTGFEDLKRSEVAEAVPGFARVNASAAPSDLGNVGGGGDAGPTIVAMDIAADPAEIAAAVKDPVLLIEAANIAMNADDRYRKNGELQAFMRHYLIAQGNIKAHQARLDQRYAAAQKAAS